MITIQRMPDIWDDSTFYTSRSAVIGELANWAVRQSPYVVPAGLEHALREFRLAFSAEEYFETDCKTLFGKIRLAFDVCPSVLDWNNAKIGEGAGRRQADYDFIDLDALARNIAHSITLSEKYSKIHD
jgi:hypothetical protein